MSGSSIQAVLERIRQAKVPSRCDVESVLGVTDEGDVRRLFETADDVRRQGVGNGVLLRGIIEFSNYCRGTCLYCGLNGANVQLGRYRLSDAEILAAAEEIHAAGIKTIVLQSGEEADLDPRWLKGIIDRIKSRFDVAITLSVGEHPREAYAMWRRAGADRYLIKIETSDPELYASLHPGMSFENRLRCLEDLEALGYQTGTGNLIGLPGQTVQTIAGDIEFFARGHFDMLSVSPFIPHDQTPLAEAPTGDLMMTLKTIALTRIVGKNTHLPASTAIGSLGGRDERPRALAAGANVVMPNFTPKRFKSLYDIYPGKARSDTLPEQRVMLVEKMVTALGRFVDLSRGDSLKARRSAVLAGTQVIEDSAK